MNAIICDRCNAWMVQRGLVSHQAGCPCKNPEKRCRTCLRRIKRNTLRVQRLQQRGRFGAT